MSPVEVSQNSSPFVNISSLYIPTVIEIASSRENVFVVFANRLSLFFNIRSIGFFADFEIALMIPSFFSGNIKGLLGNFNGNTNDEYEDRNGLVHSNQDVYNFGLSCEFISVSICLI